MSTNTNDHRHPFHLIQILLDAVTAVRPVVERIRRHDRNLADQLKRAATSAPLLVGEANKHRDGNRHAKLRLADGEVSEARIALRVAVSWRYVASEDIAAADQLYESAAKILYKLTR